MDGKRSSVAASGIISGAIAVLLALFMALTANSIALWADWVATVLDLTAVAIAWWGLRRSEGGKDEAFNYGFGRLESLASMGMAALMVISFLCITGAAFVRFQRPVPVAGLGVFIGIGLHLIFGFINVRLMMQSRNMERTENSALVTAQRRVFTVKASANALMFSSLSISFFGRQFFWTAYADPVAAMLIACSLLASASRIFKFSVRDLLDCALEEQSKLLIIRALTRHFDRYEQIHEIRTRLSGNRVYVEIFLEFSGSRLHGDVMETIHSLQEEIVRTVKSNEVLIIPVQTAQFPP